MGEVPEHLHCGQCKSTSTFETSEDELIAGKGLIRFEPIMAEFIKEFLKSSVEDGVAYVEVRAPFFIQYVDQKFQMRALPHTLQQLLHAKGWQARLRSPRGGPDL